MYNIFKMINNASDVKMLFLQPSEGHFSINYTLLSYSDGVYFLRC